MDLHSISNHKDNLAIPPLSFSHIASTAPSSDNPLPNNLLECTDSTLSEQEDFDFENKPQSKLSSTSKKIKKDHSRRDKYNVIPNDIRLELIDCVIKKGEKIKRAASRLGINYSSAKSIFQVYKKEGRSDKKCSKKNAAKHNSDAKSNFTNMPISIPPLSLNEGPVQVEKTFNSSLLEALKNQGSFMKQGNNMSLLNIQKSESAPALSANELEFTRNHSVETNLNQGSMNNIIGQSTNKTSPNNNSFLSNNSAFSKFPRNKSILGQDSKNNSGHSLDSPPQNLKTILREQQNILKETNGSKSQILLNKQSLLNSSSSALNQSFKPYNLNEKIQHEPERQNYALNQLSEDDKQNLMHALRYTLFRSGINQNILSMESANPPLEFQLKSQE